MDVWMLVLVSGGSRIFRRANNHVYETKYSYIGGTNHNTGLLIYFRILERGTPSIFPFPSPVPFPAEESSYRESGCTLYALSQ